MIYYGKQSIDEKDINSVIDVLKSDFLTQGPVIENFEKAVAEYCGVKYAVAVTNATSALHIACLAAGLDKGDILWTTPITFTASANCGRYCGADVDFVDIDDIKDVSDMVTGTGVKNSRRFVAFESNMREQVSA